MRIGVPPRALALVLVVATGLWGCGGSADPGDEEEQAFRDAASALCAAARQAEADVEQARATFYDRSHDVLHDLAREAESRADRSDVARMLELKQQVESGFDSGAPPDRLARQLGGLVEVTRSVLAQLSVPVEGCE